MLEVEVKGLKEIDEVLSILASDKWIEARLGGLIPELGVIHKLKFDRISKSTPYSAAYLGRKKPSGLRIAGGRADLGYAKDTLSLYSDLLFSWEKEGSTLTNFSDLEYAAYQESLLNDRGDSFFEEDDTYLNLIEETIGLRIEEIWQVVN